LGKEFKAAPPPDKAESVRQESDTKTISAFPDFLFPFLKGENGGIYYQPPTNTTRRAKLYRKTLS
jgi:hypothetical protein